MCASCPSMGQHERPHRSVHGAKGTQQMRRLAVAVVLLSGLVLYGSPAGAQELDAEEAPNVALAQAALEFPDLLSLLDDGGACTGVPDTLPGIFDFTAACESHDACYAEGVDRLACDEAFRADLLASCATQHPEAFDVRRYLCFGLAELYYLGVRLFGGFAFG